MKSSFLIITILALLIFSLSHLNFFIGDADENTIRWIRVGCVLEIIVFCFWFGFNLLGHGKHGGFMDDGPSKTKKNNSTEEFFKKYNLENSSDQEIYPVLRKIIFYEGYPEMDKQKAEELIKLFKTDQKTK